MGTPSSGDSTGFMFVNWGSKRETSVSEMSTGLNGGSNWRAKACSQLIDAKKGCRWISAASSGPDPNRSSTRLLRSLRKNQKGYPPAPHNASLKNMFS